MKVGYVALVGRPNVGKSTLLNTMLGQKVAIISDKPQTTRISILGIKTTEKGQIIFVDNPGIHRPLHKLNKRMMNFVHSALETSDLICLLIDATQAFGHGDEFVIETLRKVPTPLILLINKVDIIKKDKILLIIDKYKDLLNFREIIPVSALKGTNLDVLERKIYENLPEAEKLYDDDQVSDQSERFLLAEIIREKLLAHVKEELPFVTAVYIDKIEERTPKKEEERRREEEKERQEELKEEMESGASRQEEEERRRLGWQDGDLEIEAAEEPEEDEFESGEDEDEEEIEEKEDAEIDESSPVEISQTETVRVEEGKRGGRGGGFPGALDAFSSGILSKKKLGQRNKTTYIKATIFVERDNHRMIVIGRQGWLIKTIGIEARREIEDILEAKVFLDLAVKVREKWRDSADVLDLIEGQK